MNKTLKFIEFILFTFQKIVQDAGNGIKLFQTEKYLYSYKTLFFNKYPTNITF